MGVVAPLKNYPILSGRSIQSFRHIELQNLSIISDFIHRDRMLAKICRMVQRSEKEQEQERKVFQRISLYTYTA